MAEDPRLATGLAALDLVPVAQDLRGALHLDLAEYVRVATDQLLPAGVGHGGQVAGAALLHEQREEVDLEEDVTELVEERRVIAGVGRVGQLEGLLDGVGNDRALVLLAVPRALAPESTRQLIELAERPLDALAARFAHRPGAGTAQLPPWGACWGACCGACWGWVWVWPLGAL